MFEKINQQVIKSSCAEVAAGAVLASSPAGSAPRAGCDQYNIRCVKYNGISKDFYIYNIK